MSYLQIYQEKIFDLLNPNHKLEMTLREDPKKGMNEMKLKMTRKMCLFW